jgi:probable DNA metabolism protein
LRIPDNFFYYLSLHKDCNESHLIAAKGFTAQELEVSTHAKSVSQRKMVYAVLGEIHRMKAFVRLRPLGTQVLYGYLKPRHRIGGHISDHFARRTPGIMVVLGNGNESWISLCREGRIMQHRGKGMAETLARIKSALDCSGSGQSSDNTNVGALNIDDLWQVYYDSQYCPERNNPTTFRQRMPKRDQNAAGLRLIQNKKGVTLDDFL